MKRRERRLARVGSVAIYLDCSVSSVRAYLREGALTAIFLPTTRDPNKFGRVPRVDLDECDDLLERGREVIVNRD